MYIFRRSSGIGLNPALSYSLSYGRRQEVYFGSGPFLLVCKGGPFRTFQRRFRRPSPKGADYFKSSKHFILQYDSPTGIPNTRHGLRMRRRIRGGPWTLINSTEWQKLGYYNPIILNDSAYSGTSPTIMFTGDFFGIGTFQMYTATMTILH